jgi:AcrR family transcriptional regulator
MRVIKDADVRKAEILDAAGTLFNQKGYDATSISDIISHVGVARNGLLSFQIKRGHPRCAT